MANLDVEAYEIYAGETIGVESEWSVLPDGGSITVYAGGTAKNITLSEHAFLTVECDDVGLYGFADGVDLTTGGILNLSGGNAYNVKWIPLQSQGVFFPMDSRSEITFASEVTGVYLGINHWSPSGTWSELTAHAETFSGLTLQSVYNYDGSGYAETVCVMNGGLLNNSTTLGGVVQIYDGGTVQNLTVGSLDDVGEVSVYGGILKDTVVVSGGIALLLGDAAAFNTVVSTGEFTSAELGTGSGKFFDGVTVTSGGRLHTVSYADSGEIGGFRDVVIGENGEAVFFSQRVETLTMQGPAVVEISEGSVITGRITLAESNPDAGHWFVITDSTLDFDISAIDPGEADPLLNNYSWVEQGSNAAFTLTVSAAQAEGTYKLAGGATGFDRPVTVYCDSTELGCLAVGETETLSGQDYTLNLSDSLLTLIVGSVVPVEPDGLKVNFLENGVSQVLAWDAAQGKVGFMATDGNPAPSWRGVWEWPTEYNSSLGASEAELWKVVAAGKFSGSTVDHDGILLYNGIGNTFAAWTNLNDPSYGYVSLCHVDGNFQTKCLGDFDHNGFDDVIIYNEVGSVGIVSDAASYHDVWHVDDPAANPWQLLGAGTFDPSLGQDSILFKNTANNHLYLWDNQGSDVGTWNWKQTDIGYLADGWEFAAIGDFKGDGIDDIVLVNHNDNDAVFVWDDGIQSTQHYVGVLGAGFRIETVGDYNADGKEDLLLREYNTGWGGIGCWASADANQWTDFNARIETNMASQFTIVA